MTDDSIIPKCMNKQSPCCHCCNKPFVNSGYVNYCSKECKTTNLRKFKKAYADKNPISPRLPTPRACRLCGVIFIFKGRKVYCGIECAIRKKQIDYEAKPKKSTICKGCHDLFIAKQGQRYCKLECRPQTIKNKEKDRAYRRKARKQGIIPKGRERQRAKHYGVEYRHVSPLKILERDRWRCHVCLKSLDPSLRGKNKPLSPEIDHVIPISLGGPHIESNLACICRKCNINKSNKI